MKNSEKRLLMRQGFILLCILSFCLDHAFAQAPVTVNPVTVNVDTRFHEFAIPADFVGLGFETKSVVADTYGVRGNFFSPENRPLITLFRNIGIRNIRIGGGTVDGSGGDEHCVAPTPSFKDIDNLFEFARAADVKVIYSVRLLNVSHCADPNLAEGDASIVRYIWRHYRDHLDSFSIGNEPDVRGFHSTPDHLLDAAIYEAKPGVAGSAYDSYFAEWRRFAALIRKSAPGAKFSGPDTAVSDKSSFTPDPGSGVSWTVAFSTELKSSGMLSEALQHHYVWGHPDGTSAQVAIDDMLSSAWDEDAEKGTQPARSGTVAEFHPYPYVYKTVLAPLVALGVPYRMTEANDCLHGVPGASDGFASALWALDYMHWWAAHHMAGVNFHNNPWLPTDTIVPDPNPCPPSGCGNYYAVPKALGMKAFSLGSHGDVEPVTVSNPNKINLTAYAVGTDRELYVTLINKTHSTTHDSTNAAVTIEVPGFDGAQVDSMVLTDGEPGNAALMTGTLGGAGISNQAPWVGVWTALSRVQNGKIEVNLLSTTAQIVRIRAAKRQIARTALKSKKAGM
jgi:hypothetical protein